MSEFKFGDKVWAWDDDPQDAVFGIYGGYFSIGGDRKPMKHSVMILPSKNSTAMYYCWNVSHEKPQPKPVFEVGDIITDSERRIFGQIIGFWHDHAFVFIDLESGEKNHISCNFAFQPTQEELTALASREIRPGYLYRYLIGGELVDLVASFYRGNLVLNDTKYWSEFTVFKEKLIHTNKKVSISTD